MAVKFLYGTIEKQHGDFVSFLIYIAGTEDDDLMF